MDLRQDRAAKNEDASRKLNDSIDEMTPASVEVLLILCECARKDCLLVIEVPHAVYEAVREVPTRFIVGIGHEVAEFERVVSNDDGYLIVEKTGEAALVAGLLDPRS